MKDIYPLSKFEKKICWVMPRILIGLYGMIVLALWISLLIHLTL